ncbi:MAG: hypothetical protein HLUCCA11_01665 [Phormidesmis priestleyi Ana]|uniref:Uncharacterized protein n=1 Tax=Phormidesmis priestleyi Ana TaxID=1666911 RepID=A0A0P7ZRJ9_9CYAN|nr:MAG: hypothetical protein HLUCCA11_01665 [Phormidesmis priestleyi Ana]
MKNDFDFSNNDLFGPVVFRPAFNGASPINANQAWSLFFTAGQEDKGLGFNKETGRLFTNLLLAIVVTGALGAAVFTSIS